MKKIMIAAVVVCAAVMAQAAQFKWSAGAIKTFDGTSNYSGTAILTVIDAGGNTQTYTGTFVDGYIVDGSGNKGLLIGDASAADAGFIKQYAKYSAYYTTTDAAGNVFTSSTKSNLTATYPGALGVNFMGAGSWQAVPEPTSGLLLLLGVAGLALRRRRV